MKSLEFVAIVLGAWGGILSTFLAIVHLRATLRKRIVLAAQWTAESNQVQIDATNVGLRPVTVTFVDVAYGERARSAERVLVITDSFIQLLDGQTTRFLVNRSDLVEARERVALLIRRRAFVWVRVSVAGLGQVAAAIDIDAKAIGATGWFGPAEDYIAADLLIGFPRDEVLGLRRYSTYDPRVR